MPLESGELQTIVKLGTGGRRRKAVAVKDPLASGKQPVLAQYQPQGPAYTGGGAASSNAPTPSRWGGTSAGAGNAPSTANWTVTSADPGMLPE